tara:strand:- start:566 stop:691 length:126 start_codon:yes stop_codon:yes gene_type:complete
MDPAPIIRKIGMQDFQNYVVPEDYMLAKKQLFPQSSSTSLI